MPCIGRSIGSSTGGTTPVRFPIVLVVFPYDEHYGTTSTTVLISPFIMMRWEVQTASESFFWKTQKQKANRRGQPRTLQVNRHAHTHTFIHGIEPREDLYNIHHR